MAKGKIKQKKSRKELLKEDDAFLQAAGQSAEWAQQNKRAVTIGAIVFVLAIGGMVGGKEWQRIQNASASKLFIEATVMLDAEVIEPDTLGLDGGDVAATGIDGTTVDAGAASADATTAGAGPANEAPKSVRADPTAKPPTFPSIQARNEAALATFQKVLDTNADAGLKTMSRIYIGALQAKLGDLNAAQATFQGIVGDLSPSDSLYFVAAERAAYLQETKGDAAAALKTLATLQKTPTSFYSDYAAFHRARLYQSSGEVDKARKLFEGLEETHPKSSVLPEVKERLEVIGRSAPDAPKPADAKPADAKPADKPAAN